MCGSAQLRGLRSTALVVAALLTLAVAASPATAAPTPQRAEAPTLAWLDATGASALAAASVVPHRLADVGWLGGTYTVASGDRVSVYVSASYADADAVARQWAVFLAALPHGQELGLLRAYVAPLDEVQDICSSDHVIGCYGGQKLVMVGDSSAGVPPAAVAAHEYGHHVAANRANTPWLALDWGGKRWASYEGICARVAARTAFPGDEGPNYSLNPGEAFAETFRVLVEGAGSANAYSWPIIDASFRPDAQALSAVRDDVLHPWTAAGTTTIRARFARGQSTWTTTIATALDGDVRVELNTAAELTLASVDLHQVVAKGSWNSTGGKSAEYRVCGTRSLEVRVTRRGTARRFAVRIAIP
ncbi:MAG: hypothetical protein ACJ74L_04135 [Gaiellaceae bacterium]